MKKTCIISMDIFYLKFQIGKQFSLLFECIALNLDFVLYFQKVCLIFVSTLLCQSSKDKKNAFAMELSQFQTPDIETPRPT